MEEEEINYRTLRKIQQMEKNSPVLTDLKSDFYEDLSKYIENLNKRLKDEKTDQKQVLLKDEIQNTQKIAISIYEHREKKILLAAVSKARGGDPDLKNMVEIEKNLYEPIIELMLNSRKNIFNSKKENNLSKDITVKKPTEGKNEEQNENPNPILRVTKDIPEFIGTDEKKYNLRKNDVVSLPEDMSNTLSKRGVAEKIKQ